MSGRLMTPKAASRPLKARPRMARAANVAKLVAMVAAPTAIINELKVAL